MSITNASHQHRSTLLEIAELEEIILTTNVEPNHHIKHIANHLEIAELEEIILTTIVEPKPPHQTQNQPLGDCRAGGEHLNKKC